MMHEDTFIFKQFRIYCENKINSYRQSVGEKFLYEATHIHYFMFVKLANC